MNPQELRILEVGSGTGGLTSEIIGCLPEDTSEYWFTDLSILFTRQANKKYQNYRFFNTAILDISEDVGKKPDWIGRFDIVVSANALHATSNMNNTMTHVRQMLKPGGVAILLEGTAPTSWMDITFGLTEGWWHYEDKDLRIDYPLLDEHQWGALCKKVGFVNTSILKPLNLNGGLFNNQCIVIAENSRDIQEYKVDSTEKVNGINEELLYNQYQVNDHNNLTETQARIADIWEEILGSKHNDVNSSFFDVGGDSLLVAQLVSRVQSSFEVDIDTKAVFENPSIYSQALYIDNLLWLNGSKHEIYSKMEEGVI